MVWGKQEMKLEYDGRSQADFDAYARDVVWGHRVNFRGMYCVGRGRGERKVGARWTAGVHCGGTGDCGSALWGHGGRRARLASCGSTMDGDQKLLSCGFLGVVIRGSEVGSMDGVQQERGIAWTGVFHRTTGGRVEQPAGAANNRRSLFFMIGGVFYDWRRHGELDAYAPNGRWFG